MHSRICDVSMQVCGLTCASGIARVFMWLWCVCAYASMYHPGWHHPDAVPWGLLGSWWTWQTQSRGLGQSTALLRWQRSATTGKFNFAMDFKFEIVPEKMCLPCPWWSARWSEPSLLLQTPPSPARQWPRRASYRRKRCYTWTEADAWNWVRTMPGIGVREQKH